MADRQGVRPACDDYNECQCGHGDEHCMYCIQPFSAHVKREQLTTQVPADIPLDQAVEMMHRIAERDRVGLIAAGVLIDESDNQIAIR